MLLKSCFLLDLLDSAKKFSLPYQHSDTDITLLVEQIDDMKPTYQLFYLKFKSSPESVFELQRLKKFLNDVIIEGNDITYQRVKLMRFDAVKQNLQNNLLLYVEEF